MTLGELDELLRARNVESNVRPVGNGDPNATGVGKAPTLAQTLAEANEAGRRVLVRIEDSDGTPHIVEVVGTYETFDGKTVAVVNDTATTAPHRGQYGIDVDDLQRHATDTVQPLRPGETAEHPLARDNPRATEQVEGLAPREQAREQPRERAGTPPGQTPPPETVGQRARREAVEGVAIGTATELATCIAEGLPVQACVERAAGQVPQAAICGAAGGVSGALGIACTAANAAASCMAAGLSPKRCLEEAAPGMPPAAFCMAAGAFNPALGAICGAVAPAAWQAGVAVWEEQAVHRERQTLIDRNDANAASFNSRVGGLEGRIRQFESATGPVVEACLALRAAIGEVERLALQRRTAICQPASSAGGPAGSTAAVFAAADRARAAAARSRQLEQRLATDRAGLMGEINGMRQSYSRTPMMIDLVAQYETRLLVATCAMSEIDGASKRLDQAAALAVAPGAAGACPGTRMDAALGTGRGTAAAPAVPGEPCNIYVLNLSGAQVWVGTESERLQKKACSYALGSDNCSVLAPLIKKVSSHRTCSAATEAWCRDFNGTPVRAGYWSTRWNVYGEWVTTENAPDCPDAKHSPAALATATAPPPPPAAPPPATVSPAMPPVLGTAPSATRPATPGPTTLGVPPTTPTAPQTRPVPPPPTLGAAPPTTPGTDDPRLHRPRHPPRHRHDPCPRRRHSASRRPRHQHRRHSACRPRLPPRHRHDPCLRRRHSAPRRPRHRHRRPSAHRRRHPPRHRHDPCLRRRRSAPRRPRHRHRRPSAHRRRHPPHHRHDPCLRRRRSASRRPRHRDRRPSAHRRRHPPHHRHDPCLRRRRSASRRPRHQHRRPSAHRRRRLPRHRHGPRRPAHCRSARRRRRSPSHRSRRRPQRHRRGLPHPDRRHSARRNASRRRSPSCRSPRRPPLQRHPPLPPLRRPNP